MNSKTFFSDIMHIVFFALPVLVILGWFYIVIKYQSYNLKLDKYLKQYYPEIWSKISPLNNFWSLNFLDFIRKIFYHFKFMFNQDYLNDKKIVLLKSKLKFYFKFSFIYLISVIILFFIVFFVIWIMHTKLQ